MHLDPVYSLVIRLGFPLSGSTLVHKFVDGWPSKTTLDKYLMGIGAIPTSFATPIAAFVVVGEAASIWWYAIERRTDLQHAVQRICSCTAPPCS